MIQSLYTAKLGVMAQQKRIDTIANNIANVNTTGFKSRRLDFKDALYTVMKSPLTTGNNLQVGHGVLVSETSRSATQGVPVVTNEKMDLCIQGDGYFSVLTEDGNIRYTRDGCFAVSSEEDGQYLVNREGNYVLDNRMQKIRIPSGELAVGSDGTMSIGSGAPFATLNIVSFANEDGLESVGDNEYMATLASGEAEQAEDINVMQGYLEGSNVDLAMELTSLIRAQRAFSLATKAVNTADEMESMANSIRT